MCLLQLSCQLPVDARHARGLEARRAVQQEEGVRGPLLQNAQWGGWADSWVCEWSNPIEQAQGLPHSPHRLLHGPPPVVVDYF